MCKVWTCLLAALVASLGFWAVGHAVAGEYYVDANWGNDDNTGGEGDPFKTISYALTVAYHPGDNIHIAAGLYDTSHNGESFPLTMNRDVSLLGAGAEDTIIDGEGVPKHIILASNVGSPQISGLTITGGLAGSDSASEDAAGAGILLINSSPTIQDCVITDNHASGAYAGAAGIACIGLAGSCSPTIKDCAITCNTASASGSSGGAGGGIGCTAVYYGSCSATIEDCIITNNYLEATASGASSVGGAIGCAAEYGGSWSVAIKNCLIVHNGASAPSGYATGGAIYANEGSLSVTNCTIEGNSPDGVSASSCSPTLTNCIVWNNGDDLVGISCSSVSHCDIEDGDCEGQDGNISVDPKFVPTGDHPYTYYLAHLGPQAGDSPCIDAGYGSVGDYGLEGTTTCTDGRADGDDDGNHDTGPIDMGYHYPSEYTGDGDTYIDLLSFTARPNGSSIVLTWVTGAEIRNAGFELFRSAWADGKSATLITPRIIDAKGTPASGASYVFIDRDAEAGVTYYYWLVDIDTSGKWTAHGPVSARLLIIPRPFMLPRTERVMVR